MWYKILKWKKIDLISENYVICILLFKQIICLISLLQSKKIFFWLEEINKRSMWDTCTLKTSVLLLHVNHDSNFLGIWSVSFQYTLLSNFESVKIYWLSVKFDWLK